MEKRSVQEMEELIRDNATSEWERATLALNISFRWVFLAVQEAGSKSRAALLSSLSELSQTVKIGSDELMELEPLLKKSRAGAALDGEISAGKLNLERVNSIVQELTNQLNELQEQEARLKQLDSEKVELEARLSWMERHKDFDEKSVEVLRKEVERVLSVKNWLNDLAQRENELMSVVQAGLQMTDPAVLSVDDKIRSELQRLNRAQQDLQSKIEHFTKESREKETEYKKSWEELNAEQERYKEIEKVQIQVKDVLRKYADANQMMAEALKGSETGTLNDILRQVDDLLGKSDGVLRGVIEANDAAKQIRQIPL